MQLLLIVIYSCSELQFLFRSVTKIIMSPDVIASNASLCVFLPSLHLYLYIIRYLEKSISWFPIFPIFSLFNIILVAFEDPKIEGVTIYLADFERPITEKLQKDFFDDPTSTSLTCARAAAIKVGDINKDPQGEEVFEVNRSLFFKVRTWNMKVYCRKMNINELVCRIWLLNYNLFDTAHSTINVYYLTSNPSACII